MSIVNAALPLSFPYILDYSSSSISPSSLPDLMSSGLTDGDFCVGFAAASR